jgi:hypothetical protein
VRLRVERRRVGVARVGGGGAGLCLQYLTGKQAALVEQNHPKSPAKSFDRFLGVDCPEAFSVNT